MKSVETFNLRPGFFGKLPNFADFVKYNNSGDEFLSIDKWIQDGILNLKILYKNDWEKIYKNSPSYNFLFNYHGTDSFLAGSLFPSKDKSGRCYPFITIFKINKNFIPDEKFYLAPVILNHYFEKMKMIYDAAVNYSSSSEIINFTENLELDFSNNKLSISEYNDFLHRERMDDFWKRMLNQQDDFLKLTIINNLFIISSFQNLHSGDVGPGSANSLAIKFPLSLSSKNFYDGAFWINMFFDINAKSSERLKVLTSKIKALFWSYPSTGKFNSLFIIIGRISPQNFSELISGDYISGKSIDITKNMGDEESNCLTPNIKSLLNNKNLTISEFLSAF